MFTTDDLLGLDYFDVLDHDEEAIELRSKNTQHYWKIIIADGEYYLAHAYDERLRYHEQGQFATLFDAVLDIVNHDEYKIRDKYMKSRRNKRMPNKKTYFDELIERYGIV